MSDERSAALGTATVQKVLKDGSIRLVVDIEPRYRDVLASWLEPDMPVAVARVSRDVAAAEMQAAAAGCGAYGAQARELRLSGFFRAPDVWAAVGSDDEYQAWCRRQLCAWCKTEGHERDPIVYAHVRRIADGAGTAIKPALYAGIPLHNSEHMEQHQRGESAFGGKEWFDKSRIEHVQAWAWETVKRQLGVDSFRDVAPERLLEWARARGVERYLPACYQREG